jgi:hypothetical protein
MMMMFHQLQCNKRCSITKLLHSLLLTVLALVRNTDWSKLCSHQLGRLSGVTLASRFLSFHASMAILAIVEIIGCFLPVHDSYESQVPVLLCPVCSTSSSWKALGLTPTETLCWCLSY